MAHPPKAATTIMAIVLAPIPEDLPVVFANAGEDDVGVPVEAIAVKLVMILLVVSPPKVDVAEAEVALLAAVPLSSIASA